MFDYLKQKIQEFTTKEYIAKGKDSIGYVDIKSPIKFDVSDTLILAEGDDTGKTSPLLITNYKNNGLVKSILKQKINEKNYSLRCFFDEDLEDFIQINVIDYNIDSAICYKRFQRIFYNKSKEKFVDTDGIEYTEDLWSNTIIGNKFFSIEEKDYKCEYERVFASKDIYNEFIKNEQNKYEVKIEECLYQRGIESDYVNRELALISHLDTKTEKSINIYIGLDINLSTLKIS